MIHHISIAARNPLHVAQVIAEAIEGEAMPFPPHEGSYMVLTYDDYGTMIEVYPHGTEMTPGQKDEQSQFIYNPSASYHSPTHAAISVSTTEEKIKEIANREGWRAIRCDREGYFEVIEFWVDNQFLLELLTPEMASRYLSFMQPDSLKAFVRSMAPQELASV